MPRRVTQHVRHNVVAYLALFAAFGGTSAWAAGQITGEQIKNESLTGADVLNNSLTGADIDESSLASSGDANTLDGKDSTDFLGASAKAADADKLDGAVDTEVATLRERKIVDWVEGSHARPLTVTCPNDGIAVRGSHSEERWDDPGAPFDSVTSEESYTRSSYSVKYEMTREGQRDLIVTLKVRCLTSTAP